MKPEKDFEADVMERFEMSEQSVALLNTVKTIIITDEEGYRVAAQLTKEVKDHMKKIVEYFKDIKEAAFKAHKNICALESEELKPLKQAEDILKKGIKTYLNEMERIRIEKQAEEERKARERAEKERQALLEKAAKAKTEEKQEALLEKAEAVYVEPVVVEHEVQKTTKVDGGRITRKKEIEVTITDPLLLIKSIAEGKAPITIVDFKMSVVKSWVKSAGITNGQIPGLQVRETLGVSIT